MSSNSSIPTAPAAKSSYSGASKVTLNFTVILDRTYKRITAILLVSVIALGFGRVITSDFIIRGMNDQRVEYPREWLAAAAERFPQSARVNLRLASAEIAEATGNEQLD